MLNDEVRQAIENGMKEAARIGAETAKAELDAARRAQRDRQRQNTKLILKQYRTMRFACQNSVNDCLTYLGDENIRPESTFRTFTLLRHVERMLDLYLHICEETGREDHMRRYRTIMAVYIDGDSSPDVETVAAAGHVDRRTVYKDIDAAVETLSALFFGIDALRLEDG